MSPAGRFAYHPALDGVRALSVLAVLAFHADLAAVKGGFLGVSAFFTLSGYLITQILLSEWDATGRIDLAAFWVRRLRRLMPAALLGLLGVVLAALLFSAPRDPGQFAGDVIGSLLYVANWRFIATGQDYAAIFRDPSPLQHFWSLGIEEQFYLFYPPLMLILLRSRAHSRRAFVALLGLGIVISSVLAALLYVPGEPIARAYFGTDTRAAELLVGALLAVWIHGAPELRTMGRASTLLGSISMCAILASWALADTASPWLYRGGLLAHAVAVACVLNAIDAPGPLGSLMSAKPLRWIGRISYGLYIYHWPIYLWLDDARTGLAPWPLFGVRVLATFAVAAVSYRLVEQPIRSTQHFGQARFEGRRSGLAALGVAAGILVLLGLGSTQWSDEGAWATDAVVVRDETRFSDTDLPRVLVVGDSLSLNVGRGLFYWGRRTGRARFAVQGVQGCPMAIGGEVLQRIGPLVQNRPDCRKHMRDWCAFIDQHRPDIVVLLTGGLDLFDRRMSGWDRFLAPGDPALDDWLVSEYVTLGRSLSARGAELIWLTWPCAAPPPAKKGPFAGTHALDTARVRHLNERILPRVERELGGAMRIADLFGRLCPGGDFAREVDSIPNARPDGLHLSRATAVSVANWLGPKILSPDSNATQ